MVVVAAQDLWWSGGAGSSWAVHVAGVTELARAVVGEGGRGWDMWESVAGSCADVCVLDSHLKNGGLAGFLPHER